MIGNVVLWYNTEVILCLCFDLLIVIDSFVSIFFAWTIFILFVVSSTSSGKTIAIVPFAAPIVRSILFVIIISGR